MNVKSIRKQDTYLNVCVEKNIYKTVTLLPSEENAIVLVFRSSQPRRQNEAKIELDRVSGREGEREKRV